MKQDSFQYHCFDIQEAGFFQTPGVFIDLPGRNNLDYLLFLRLKIKILEAFLLPGETKANVSYTRLAPSLFRDISALRNIVTSAGA